MLINNNLKKVFIGFLYLSIVAGCSSDDNNTIVGDTGNLVETTIDLASGFKGNIIITIDSESYFTMFLSGIEPFSGAQASLKTYLSRGEHTMTVRQSDSEADFEETVTFELGDAEEYFIALFYGTRDGIWDLFHRLQDRPFGYL